MAHGRKIAGVAQAMRQGFALVAGVLLVSQDPAPVTALLNEFYAAAGRRAEPRHRLRGSLGRAVAAPAGAG